MEVGIQRTDSQRVHANGPRVSFNRDVHVKRIGKRPNETANYPIQTTNLQPPQTYKLRRELPKDRSEESILKEAALVLAQAERIRCKAEGSSDIVDGRVTDKNRGKTERTNIPNQFYSLPSRKKNSKPITRSVSDASSKRAKKPSIFSIFRKSDTQLDQVEPDRRFKESGGRRLIRSKSDASPSRCRKLTPKKNNSENDEIVTSSKSTQLSPIVENIQKEDYFEGILERIPADHIENNSNKERQKNAHQSLKESIGTQIREKHLAGNIGFTSDGDLDLIPSKPVSDAIKDVVVSLASYSKSLEDMHSSQLPAEKPPLTKGLTVDGMVKRLSMERFSPPPTISGPAFSYTRPNEQIIYAQVVCDSEGRLNEDIHHSRDLRDMDSSYKYQTNGFEHRSDIGRNKFASQNKTEVYISENFGSQYCTNSSPTFTRMRSSNSPHHWKHSPRNLSDEDEGLGFEPRKYFEDDLPIQQSTKKNFLSVEYERNKSPSCEPPIIPVIRSVSPIEVNKNHRDKADGVDFRKKEPFSEISNLSCRREALESKIKSRRFGSSDILCKAQDIKYRYSPERSKEFKKEFGEKYTESDMRFHKLNSREIIDRYSPERTHLDMVSPSKDIKTSRYSHTKVYDDGSGGVKEIYERETHIDEHGKPHTRELRRRERLESPKESKDNDEYRNGQIEDKYRQDYEPKSLDSQFSETNRSSPDALKRSDFTMRKQEEYWHKSLTRDKKQQRSFDKGDSGIENDFRKEPFNGDLTTKWRKRTIHDDIKSCEQFIKQEKRHTEEQHPQRKKYDFVYRERSIDDGSHFDPRLDKYPKGTIRKKENTLVRRSPSPSKETAVTGTLIREKKVGGFERVKKLFSSGRQKGNKRLNGKHEPGKDRYMVKEEEMRSRYHEYKGVAANLREPNVPDISTRRRLSTPKASPLLKRTSSEKIKPSPVFLRSKEENSAEKSSWFKSLDRKTKKKYSEELRSPYRTPAVTEDETSTLRSKKSYRTTIAAPVPEKSLRFFGDTDQESNPSFSKIANSRNQKYSRSACNLDRIPKQSANRAAPRSNSLQNLEDGLDELDRPRRRHHSRSRELADISESASDAEDRKEKRHSSSPKTLPRDMEEKSHAKYHYEEHVIRSSNDRDSRTPQRESSDTTRIEFRKPPLGPPKPARSSERSHNYASLSRERDRLHDSSGTEGESSLPSQRSVVYLHATTIGAIPQPYQLNSRRRAVSKEELRSKNKNQPMTRTVSRSVSMLAPWKPKHLHEGYEINYSQETPDKHNKMTTMARKSSANNTSKARKADTVSRTRKNLSSKDDLSSVRNSSMTSASKSGITSSHTGLEKRSGDLRKDTLNKRRMI